MVMVGYCLGFILKVVYMGISGKWNLPCPSFELSFVSRVSIRASEIDIDITTDQIPF